jgi:hypothetical protein
MLRLIRNCSHKNDVATYYFEKNQEKAIIKASSTKAGIEDIKREVEGWVWYQSKRYPNTNESFCKIIQSRENYIKIGIKYIEGHKENYLKGIVKNSQLIGDVIVHYCNIWCNNAESKVPLHGDLSIDNVINNKEGIHIIDWEHFSLSSAPFGFDAYNLLFEQLGLSMKGRKIPSKAELDILLDNIRLIRSASTETSVFFDRILSSVQDFIKTNSKLWNKQIYRLPVLDFNEESVKMIDKMIRKYV